MATIGERNLAFIKRWKQRIRVCIKISRKEIFPGNASSSHWYTVLVYSTACTCAHRLLLFWNNHDLHLHYCD